MAVREHSSVSLTTSTDGGLAIDDGLSVDITTHGRSVDLARSSYPITAAPVVISLHHGPDGVAATPFSRTHMFYIRYGKRIIDLLIVAALSPLWLPVYLILAAALLLVQGRPIHYLAPRPGRGQVPFQMMKFRTMHVGADAELGKLLSANPDLALEYTVLNKLKDDPRLTPMGAFLRKTSLDELPQLWNVLIGDMSLVGPRPPANLMEQDRYGTLATFIFQDRPGLTGMWQASERHTTPYERKIWYDLSYAHRCSLWLDLSVLVKTVPTVVARRGSF